MSECLHLLGGEKETLRYLEPPAEIRSRAPAYREYPTGTNFWLWSGKKSLAVLISLYRRANYVLRTRSYFEGDKIRRVLEVIKSPAPTEKISVFEYCFRKGIPVLKQLP